MAQTEDELSGRPTGELLRSIAGDSASLVRKEIELGRQELLDAVSARVAALVVTGFFGGVALGGLALALLRARRPPLLPEETARTLKEDVEWAKTQLRR